LPFEAATRQLADIDRSLAEGPGKLREDGRNSTSLRRSQSARVGTARVLSRSFVHGESEVKSPQERAVRLIAVALFMAGVAGAVVHGQTVRGTPADERAIRDLVALHATSSQQGDLEGLVAGLHADADSRRADGAVVSGRTEIEQRYRGILSGGPTRMAHAHPPESVRIRFLQPDVAFVDVDSVSVSGEGLRTPFFLVFTKVQDKWGVAVERSGIPLK